ncbi:hypothetical protein TOPH_07819 [Tolypocladium ophioglossoides CBS 100239]|uniref:ABC transporter TMD0 domain-containing protein n=1 Tax=Tolypocladium ophioglossoides (strain CBS 100239) TaxID=1163406 RepID=A0A0L0N0I7_TOLOC|nr:hypothetical protein TOPH_07819 [Tolypocladium ophioglossoides CBS 100239]
MDFNLANTTVGASDDSFSPQVQRQFDFTLLFEHTILTILPSCLLLVASPVYIFTFVRKPVFIRRGLLLWTKLATAGLLFGVELANLILWSWSGHSFRSSTSLAAASLSCITTLCVAAVLHAEHRHSLRSSAFLSVYLSITLLFDVVKARSYFGRSGLNALGALTVVVAVLKLILVLLEEASKRSLIRLTRFCPTLGPETTNTGFWTRSLFLWLNTTLLIGFRNVIRAEQLQDIGPEFSSERLFARFEPKWKTGQSRACHPEPMWCADTPDSE